jgi:hypothetical protein
MKNKDEDTVDKSFAEIVGKNSVLPVSVLSDSDSSFLSSSFEKIRYSSRHCSSW